MVKYKKNLLVVIFVVFLIATRSVAVSGYTAPTPPPALTPPPSSEEPTPPPAPTPPPVPGEETPTPEPSSEPDTGGDEVAVTEEQGGTDESTNGESGDTTSETGGDAADTTSGNQEEQSSESGSSSEEQQPASVVESGGETDNGNAGSTVIETGDANSSAELLTDANSNLSFTPEDGGGITVANEGNGDGSDNDNSLRVVDDDLTVQDNSATVVNTLEQSSVSGDNSASKNVGDSTIDTGDANTSGTIITSVNTNVDGVAMSEFNIADDHMGDIILDFGSCVVNCGSDLAVINDGNGSDSDNTNTLDLTSNDSTFQNNDATIENNMVLNAISGENTANANTGGDSTITTGDANVSANVLNLVNNNIAGGVIYSVVNIFGNLVGDIIFPDGVCCFADATVGNVGNGDGSTNSTALSLDYDDQTFQFNVADLENNIIVDANTGDNIASRNTGGNNYIETGDSSIELSVLNIANTNISGGDWWLVIVNEAGNWIGKIMGADGNHYAGSDGFEFAVDENGEVYVANSGNGAGSTNNNEVNIEQNDQLVQTNEAKIVNNLDLTANTGDNSTSRNTNGDNSITTGDATVIASIVNFVNNNISGDGRLFVNVINIFGGGSWIGDFIGPGMEKDDSPPAHAEGYNNGGSEDNGDSGVGGYSFDGGSDDSSYTTDESNGSDPDDEDGDTEGSSRENRRVASRVVGFSGLIDDGDSDGGNGPIALGSGDHPTVLGSQSSNKDININLAWPLTFIVLGGLYYGIGRIRKKIAYTPNSTARIHQ